MQVKPVICSQCLSAQRCLKKQFKTPKDAESSYFGHQDLDTAPLVINTTENNVSVTESLEMEPSVCHFNQLPMNAQLELLSKQLSSYASSEMKLYQVILLFL